MPKSSPTARTRLRGTSVRTRYPSVRSREWSRCPWDTGTAPVRAAHSRIPARTVTVKNPRRKKTLQPELPTGARMITRAQRVSTVRYSRKYPSSFCGLYRYRASTTAPRVQNTAMAIHCSTVRKVRAATPFSGNRAAHAINWASGSMPGTPKSASAGSRWLNQIPANPMVSASAPAAAGSRNRFFIIKRPPAKLWRTG